MATTTRDDVIARLDEGIAALTSSERWTAWLRVQARFHRYSFGNVLLIELARPGATRVAGFRAWQRLGRTVRRGERGIPILAPVVRRGRLADAGEAPGDDHAPSEVRRVAAWVVAHVFDISQTDGQDLPEICSRLRGEDPHGTFEQLLAVAGGHGYRVEDADLAGGANGECLPGERLIRLQRGLAPAQRVKTLAHELAHSDLHQEGYVGTPRPLAELEAESVAFIVCQAAGIDSGEYSFGYLATWSGGGDEARTALRTSAQRIQRAAAAILDAGVAEAAA
jgi:antirestriction protein ArdC